MQGDGSRLSSSMDRNFIENNTSSIPQPQNEDDLLTSHLLVSDDSRAGEVPSRRRRMLLRSDSITRSARQAIRRLGNYLAYFTIIAMLIMVPIVLYRALRHRKIDIAAYNSAWIMVCGTIVLSVRLVYLHLTHWYMPEVQKYVVRIVWMVPLYAMQSYLSLRFHQARIYIDTVRDFYEAYVIASFVYYLMELLGGQDALVEILRHKDPAMGKHSFPLSLILQPWELGLEFALQCKHGVLQYVVFKVCGRTGKRKKLALLQSKHVVMYSLKIFSSSAPKLSLSLFRQSPHF